MAAVTQTSNEYSQQGNKTVVTATFTSPADAETWDTGLAIVDHVSFTLVEADVTASDAVNVASISGGTVTLDVEGTVTSCLARAEGV